MKHKEDMLITISQAGKQAKILLSELFNKGRAWLTTDAFVYYAPEVPVIRHAIAQKAGVAKHWHIHSSGGLGDQICATGLVDYIHEVLQAKEIIVSCHYPEIYYGRKYVRAIKIKSEEYEKLDWSKYFTVETLVNASRPISDWLSLHMTNCMDAAALVALGRTLPDKYKKLVLPTTEDNDVRSSNKVILHPGLTWPSRTIPASWWNALIKLLQHQGKTPVIIGAKCPNGNSTVEGLELDGCIDYRNKLSFHETLNIMCEVEHIVTNDSAPYHMACSTDATVHVLSTGRPFDYIKHPMKNNVFDYALGCKLNTIDLNTRSNNVNIYTECTEEEMMSWLPNPRVIVERICSK